jgi:ABC-type protease/lipase transport system fused ATPase/permease subunit
MSEDQIDEIVSTTAAAIEAEVEKMICALPDGFDTADAVTRLAEFLNRGFRSPKRSVRPS